MSEIHGREQEYMVSISRPVGTGQNLPGLTFSTLAIPNFLRIARWKARGRPEHVDIGDQWGVDDLLASSEFFVPKGSLIRVLVARFVGIQTFWCKNTNRYIPWAAYEWLAPQPPQGAVRKSEEWQNWLEMYDREGDILIPRIDAAGE